MKPIYLYILFALLIISCKQGDGNQNTQENVGTENTEENIETTVPGIEKLEFTDSIYLAANQNMRFDKDLFRIKAGNKIILNFKNTEAKSEMSMLHNVVVLNKGTDIVDFTEEAAKASADQYIPSKFASSIISHTRAISGQESEQIEFTIPEPGVYYFICSYPGHWGTMQGKIVAE